MKNISKILALFAVLSPAVMLATDTTPTAASTALTNLSDTTSLSFSTVTGIIVGIVSFGIVLSYVRLLKRK